MNSWPAMYCFRSFSHCEDVASNSSGKLPYEAPKFFAFATNETQFAECMDSRPRTWIAPSFSKNEARTDS